MGMRYNRVKQLSGEVTFTVARWLDTLPKRRMISISGNIFIEPNELRPNILYISSATYKFYQVLPINLAEAFTAFSIIILS